MRLILSIFLMFISLSLYSQRSFDGECIIGFDGRIMNFSQSSPSFELPISYPFSGFSSGASSIADTNGRLAVAFSGYTLWNRTGDSIWGGTYLNDGKLAQYDSYYSTWTQNSLILPKGNDEYYVFKTGMSDKAFDDWDNGIWFRFDRLTYHLVDMKENNGLGRVMKKNQILMQDAVLSNNRLTAVKHGNGRDWWLVLPHQKEHKFYLFLVSADGISGPYIDSVDYPEIGEFIYGKQLGQSAFNRSGTKYAYCTNTTGGVYVLNFDRCSGKFSKYHYYSVPRDTTVAFDFPDGTCFSPNDTMLYVNTSNNIFQIDISDTTSSSLQFIHGPDVDSANEIFQQYSNIYLGADDRLYIGNFHGIKSTMSYIEEPNKRGLACNFCRRCLQIPNNNAKGLPNMPWYHLGKKEGSACDTIGKLHVQEIKLYPNPVGNELTIYLPVEYNRSVKTNMFNLMGQLLFTSISELNAKQEYTIDLSTLTKGIYVLQIESEGQVWKEKIVKE